MVSYACQRQSSSLMLPSAALMPPCAATVWLRVGNSFVIHLQEHEEEAHEQICMSAPLTSAKKWLPRISCQAAYRLLTCISSFCWLAHATQNQLRAVQLLAAIKPGRHPAAELQHAAAAAAGAVGTAAGAASCLPGRQLQRHKNSAKAPFAEAQEHHARYKMRIAEQQR